MTTPANTIQDFANQEYKWGFVTDIDEDRIPKGLNEDVIRLISAKKREPEFMLEWRLKAYRHWAPAGAGRRPSPSGPTFTTRRSTIRTSSTTRRPSRSRS